MTTREETFFLSDLWRFDPATNQWTWVSGSNRPNQSGIYGMQGLGVLANRPGAREGAVGWCDKAGGFWLFGGQGYDGLNYYDYFNDIWLLKAPMSAVERNAWERLE